MIRLREKYPDLPAITLIVMAGDIASRDIADKLVGEGIPVLEAAVYIGSYARLDWLIEHYEKGNIPETWLLDGFPEEWSGCDPDDCDPKFLRLWEEAWRMNYCNILCSDEGVPANIASADVVTVYRGQLKRTDPLGIAWTTDKEIAKKFAHGAGLRVPANGVVITRRIKVSDIYGYLTGRGESEVVLDPSKLLECK